MSEQIQKNHDVLYDDVKQFFITSGSGKLSITSITTLTRYAMEVVQTGRAWKGMKGSEKKALVFEVISDLVEDLLNDTDVVGDLDNDIKQGILTATTLVPTFIDAAVDFAKIYKIQSKFFCCC